MSWPASPLPRPPETGVVRVPPESLLDHAQPAAPGQPDALGAAAPFVIAATAGGPAAAIPPEPRFDTSELVEFGEPERLDPHRATTSPEGASPDGAGPEEPPPAPPQTASRLGMAGSIGIHLLPLLLLATWPVAPSDVPLPIPVQLIVLKEPEPTPPPPPPPPPPEAKPPSGRLASVEVGDPAAPRDKLAAAAQPAPEPPKETKTAAVPAPPKPPSPALVSALPKPTPTPEPDLKPSEPEPLPPEKPAVKERVAARPAPHHGDVPGPSASRSQYLAYCMMLVRQHYGILPPSFLAGRRGMTVVNILVLGDGTIARVDIARHSGYADIDGKVEQMIAAVHRFPPLPQWIQRSSITMTFELAFPEGLLER